MFEIDAGRLAEVSGARLVVEGARPVRGFALDSREAGGDSAFLAMAGEFADGNDYAASALRAGAAAAVMTREPSEADVAAAAEAGASLLVAGDGERFMLEVAGWWRREHPEWTVVGVTGSNGKTTTKDMVAAVLAGTYKVHATAGNHNNRLGLPLTVLAAPDDAQVLVLEMGMNSAGEIDDLARCAAPQMAVITNVGTAHIGMLGSREGIARAKAEIVGNITDAFGSVVLAGGARLVLFGEDDYAGFVASEFAGPAGVGVLRAGWRDGDDVRGHGLALDEAGRARFTVAAGGSEQPMGLAVTGKPAATDALFATAVGLAFGVPLETIAGRLAACKPTRMRQEMLVRADGLRLIDDSYNASPESMAAALAVLNSIECAGQRVAVLGEMGEQGDAARDLHRLVGAYAAATAPDILAIVGGELADEMAQAAQTMGLDAGALARYDTVGEALDALNPVLSGNDLVVVKASRAAGLDAFSQGVMQYAR